MLGVKESARLNKAMTAINILIAAFIVISGSFRLNSDNWRVTVMISSSNTIIFNQIDIERDQILILLYVSKTDRNATIVSKNPDLYCAGGPEKCGEGGFMPFGFTGVVAASAKCFYAYIGRKLS